MSGLKVGDRVSIRDRTIHWENGQTSPAWCVEPGRTFEVIQISARRSDGTYRVVIGNHRLNNGPITKGVTGAIIVNSW